MLRLLELVRALSSVSHRQSSVRRSPVDCQLRAMLIEAYDYRAERLMDRSGIGAGVGEYDRVAPTTSMSCSCSTTAYLGSRMNLGMESLAS